MLSEFISTFHGDVDLTYHAAEQMVDDKRGEIPLPTFEELLDNENVKLVEFYEPLDRQGIIQKAVFRLSQLSENYDYSYVVARDGVVVTAWANDKNDIHRLTESKDVYISGPKDPRLKSKV